jgi:glycine/sarcosine N-methyltransferase
MRRSRSSGLVEAASRARSRTRFCTGGSLTSASRSFEVASERPFYRSMADAYDRLITTPVEPWVDAVEAVMAESGAPAGSLLDAGCGTGRYAAAFASAGHQVTLVDASADLLKVAAARCPGAHAEIVDICSFDLRETFDAVICRGVLNDLVDDEERSAALGRLACHVALGGALILDVREAGAAHKGADGKTRGQTVPVAGGELHFESVSRWSDGILSVTERTEWRWSGKSPIVESYEFRMRPWAKRELRISLASAGMTQVSISGGIHGDASDRLFVVARR